MDHGLASRRTARVRRALLFVVAVSIALLSASPAAAQSDIDLEVAKRRFAAGANAYQRGEYEAALVEFLAARQIHDVPALHFNIGRCLDRLGRWKEAADAYEHYLASEPSGPDAAELRTRVALLRQRDAVPPKPVETTAPPRPAPPVVVVAQPPAPASPKPERARRLMLAASITGAFTLALGAAGGGVYGHVYSDFAARRDACAGACDPTSYDGLRDSVHRGQIASGVLFGLAGTALVSDVVLWTLWSRARAEH